jgi:hypothetical protein
VQRSLSSAPLQCPMRPSTSIGTTFRSHPSCAQLCAPTVPSQSRCTSELSARQTCFSAHLTLPFISLASTTSPLRSSHVREPCVCATNFGVPAEAPDAGKQHASLRGTHRFTDLLWPGDEGGQGDHRSPPQRLPDHRKVDGEV